jgi:hypothetical protein
MKHKFIFVLYAVGLEKIGTTGTAKPTIPSTNSRLLWLGLALLCVSAAPLSAEQFGRFLNCIIGETVDVPAEIDGKPVTSIGEGAFVGTSLTRVTIPAGITSIGSSAFPMMVAKGWKREIIAINDKMDRPRLSELTPI